MRKVHARALGSGRENGFLTALTLGARKARNKEGGGPHTSPAHGFPLRWPRVRKYAARSDDVSVYPAYACRKEKEKTMRRDTSGGRGGARCHIWGQ